MPDFAKALRFNPSLRLPSLAEQLQFLKSRHHTTTTVNPLPPGELQSNPLGSLYLTHAVYPEDYFHGKIRLSRLSSFDLECLIDLMQSRVAVPHRDRIVFLDTETTGAQGGAGICAFLVGIGYFAGDDFQMVQYFIRDFDEEPSMLLALGERLQQFELAVTYNGAAFDIPLLEARYTLARLESPFRSMSHFDLLFTARKLWRSGHGSCRLVALERELLSFLRGPDIPGAMIPRAYFDYLRRRPDSVLPSVFTHNVHDVISLAALTVHACDRVMFEPGALDEPLDLFSIARVVDTSPEWRRSIRLYEMALAGGLPEPIRKKALENLAVVYRRAGEHDRSREMCEQLIRYPEFSMTGYEGAAIYHERVDRDLEAALNVLEEGLARAQNKRCRMMLQGRWDRLQQKIMKYE